MNEQAKNDIPSHKLVIVDYPSFSDSGQVQSTDTHPKPKSQEHAMATQAARRLIAALEGFALMHFFFERFVATHMLRSSYLREGKSSEYVLGFTVADEYEGDDGEWVRLLTDPNHVHRRGGKADELFVDVCVGMIGKLGSMADKDTDTQASASKNGGFFFRRSSQVFPMLRFRQDRLEDFSAIRDKVERAVSDIFQSRPSTSSSVLMALPNGRRSSYNPRKVQKWDVICDRTDSRTPNHFGNKRFSIVVCMYLIKDYDMKNVTVRVRVSRSIILTIHEGDPGGRFLAKTRSGSWKEIDDTLAIKWISLILKTAALEAERHEKPKDPKVIADSVKFSLKPNAGSCSAVHIKSTAS